MNRKLLMGAAVTLLLFAGCATSSVSTPAATRTAGATGTAGSDRLACTGLDTVDSALSSLAKVGDQTTIGEVKAIQQGLSTALTALDRVTPATTSSALTDLKTASDQLSQSLAGLPDGDTLGQHGPQLQQFKAQVAKAQSAESQMSAKLNCGD